MSILDQISPSSNMDEEVIKELVNSVNEEDFVMEKKDRSDEDELTQNSSADMTVGK